MGQSLSSPTPGFLRMVLSCDGDNGLFAGIFKVYEGRDYIVMRREATVEGWRHTAAGIWLCPLCKRVPATQEQD